MMGGQVYLLFEDRSIGYYGKRGGFNCIKGIYSTKEKAEAVREEHGNYPQIMAIELDKEVDIGND